MKKNKVLQFGVVVMLLFSVVSCGNDPKVGEVWRYRPNGINKNPFKEAPKLKSFYDYKIIDVKGEYVLYMDLSDSTPQSSTISMFKIEAERISNCK